MRTGSEMPGVTYETISPSRPAVTRIHLDSPERNRYSISQRTRMGLEGITATSWSSAAATTERIDEREVHRLTAMEPEIVNSRRVQEDLISTIKNLKEELNRTKGEQIQLVKTAEDAMVAAVNAEGQVSMKNQRETSLQHEVLQLRMLTEAEVRRSHDQHRVLEERLQQEGERNALLEKEVATLRLREAEAVSGSDEIVRKAGHQYSQLQRESQAETAVLLQEVETLRESKGGDEAERRRLVRTAEESKEQLEISEAECTALRKKLDKSAGTFEDKISSLKKKLKESRREDEPGRLQAMLDSSLEKERRRIEKIERDASEAIQREREGVDKEKRRISDELEKERRESEKEIIKLKRQLDDYTHGRDDDRRRIQEEFEKERILNRRSFEEERRTLTDEYDRERFRLRKAADEAEQQTELRESKMKVLRDSHASEMDLLRKKLDASDKECEELSEAIRKMKSGIDKSESLRNRLTHTEEEFERLNEETRRMRTENHDLISKNQREVSELQLEFQTECQEQQRKFSDLKRKLSHSEVENDGLRSESETLKTRIDELSRKRKNDDEIENSKRHREKENDVNSNKKREQEIEETRQHYQRKLRDARQQFEEEINKWQTEAINMRKRVEGLPGTPEDLAAERLVFERRLLELEHHHDEELRRSDAIHARQCNDLVENLETSRTQRDVRIEEQQQLIREIEMLKAENISLAKMGVEGDNELRIEIGRLKDQLSKQSENESSADEETKKMRKLLSAKDEELVEMRENVDRVARCERQKENEMRKGFEDLRNAHDDQLQKGDYYRSQLKDATRDYRELEGHLAMVEDEHQRMHSQYSEMTRNSQQLIHDISGSITDIKSNARKRSSDGKTPYDPIASDVSKISQRLSTMGRRFSNVQQPSIVKSSRSPTRNAPKVSFQSPRSRYPPYSPREARRM